MAEINDLRQTVARLETARASSQSQSLDGLQPPFNTLSITDIVGNSLAQQPSQSVASPATPGHSPLTNVNSSSDSGRDVDNSLNMEYSSRRPRFQSPPGNVNDAVSASDAEDGVGRGHSTDDSDVLPVGASHVSPSGGRPGALDPLLLEAEHVISNPMFGMDAQGMSVPATPSSPALPTSPAASLLQAVALQQASLMSLTLLLCIVSSGKLCCRLVSMLCCSVLCCCAQS